MQTDMEPDIEKMTRKYSDACAWAVRHAIDMLTIQWDTDTKNYLREQGYDICTELYEDSLIIYAYVAKDDYYGHIRYEDDNLNEAIQEVFDKLGFQVVFNAMLRLGMEDVNQIIHWRIK